MCVRCVCVAVFSNIVVEEKLRALAEADERSVVKQVQEFYADFYAINPDLFTLNLGQTCVARLAQHVTSCALARGQLCTATRLTQHAVACLPHVLNPMRRWSLLSGQAGAVALPDELVEGGGQAKLQPQRAGRPVAAAGAAAAALRAVRGPLGGHAGVRA